MTDQGAEPQDLPRDARLAQALRHLPDAHMTASPQVRAAVLRAAMRSVQPATPGWRAALAKLWSWWVSGAVGPAAVVSVFVVTVVAGVVYQQRDWDAAPAPEASAGPPRVVPAQGRSDAPALPTVQNRAAVPGDVQPDRPEPQAADRVLSAASPRRVTVPAAPAAPAAKAMPRAATPVGESAVSEATVAAAAEPVRERSMPAPVGLAPPAAPARAEGLGSSQGRVQAPDPREVHGAWVRVNGQRSAVATQRVQALLTALQLAWAQSPGLADAASGAVTGAGAGAGGALQLPGGESWTWADGRLRYRSAAAPDDAPAPERSLNPAQQAELNRLALQAVAP